MKKPISAKKRAARKLERENIVKALVKFTKERIISDYLAEKKKKRRKSKARKTA